ncbi:MAG: response regulator transcription factor [Actinomycetaceae bacterium]|nr:response regulator transcription factor [Actinomycetaceae bacterium]
MNILIAEDEERIARFIEKGLKAEGIGTLTATDGATALDWALNREIDLLILDIGLPVIDGFTVLRRLRQAGSTLPVIVLTARDSAQDTIRGLEGGADDYMAKPFSFGELLARIRLRIREDQGGESSVALVRAGDLQLDIAARQATYRGRVHDLSAREFALLRVLGEHHGQVLSRAQLLDQAWDLDFDPGSNVVDVYVGYLRAKFGSDAIETVRGMGYKLVT